MYSNGGPSSYREAPPPTSQQRDQHHVVVVDETVVAVVETAAAAAAAVTQDSAGSDDEQPAQQIPPLEQGHQHLPQLASLYTNIAELARTSGESLKALEFHGRAQAIQEKALGMDHPDLARTYSNIAELLMDMDTSPDKSGHERAMPLLETARAIQERRLPGDHPELAMVYAQIARAHSARGEHDVALKLGIRALAMLKKSQGAEHARTVAVASLLKHIRSVANADASQ
eukprot:COSAG01_NODE_14042_length_1503_cov_8.582397_2_plen_229_part_00